MKRRQVLTSFMGFAAASMLPRLSDDGTQQQIISGVIDRRSEIDPPALDPVTDREQPVAIATVSDMDQRDSQTMIASSTNAKALTVSSKPNLAAKEINKSIDFARDYDDDIFVAETDLAQLQSVFLRLKNLQKTIGFGHFNLVTLDEALVYGKRFSAIGEFTATEKEFMEKLFFTDASDYGFYGKKVTEQYTASLNKSSAVKIPYSGHYLLKGESLDYYQKLTKDVGKNIILTSGIRSNIKQFYLFLAKTVRVKGNLSRASRSLAPPGYSYHGIGDFDVGKVGWGARNFSDDFATTDEFKKMQDLGYIAIRYDHGNQFGVRFEPWHIKVV